METEGRRLRSANFSMTQLMASNAYPQTKSNKKLANTISRVYLLAAAAELNYVFQSSHCANNNQKFINHTIIMLSHPIHLHSLHPFVVNHSGW